jgi:hypothetical protein
MLQLLFDVGVVDTARKAQKCSLYLLHFGCFFVHIPQSGVNVYSILWRFSVPRMEPHNKKKVKRFANMIFFVTFIHIESKNVHPRI